MTTLVPIALSLLLQSTGLLLLGLLALRLTHSRGPAVQTLIGRSTLAGVALLLLLAPLTGHVHPLWHVTLEPAAARPGAAKPTPPRSSAPLPGFIGGKREGKELRTSPSPSFRGEEDKTAREEGAVSSTPTPVIPPPRPPLWGGPLRSEERTSKEVGSYAAITLTLLLWLAVCQGHLTRLSRTATPLTSGPATDLLAELTPRPPQLLTHPSVRSPFLAGLVRPAIFLPPTYATDFDPAALRAILAHELAHLQRRDNAWTLAARLLCTLLWPQPLLWLVCRHLEQIAEDACDTAVLAQNCPPRTYADCLLTLAERHPLPRRQRALGAGVAPYCSSLGRRVQRILTQGKQTMLPISTKLRLTIAALTLAAVLGGVCLVSSVPAQVTAGRVSPAPGQAQATLLIGTWLYENQPIAGGKEGLVTYQPDGKFAYLFPGTARHEPEQSFGTYVLNGSKIKEFGTSASFDDPNQIGKSNILPTDVNFATMQFQVSGDTLTVRDGSGEVSVAKRLSAIDAETTKQRFLQTTDDLTQARFLAGLTAVQGPGVIATLRDSKQPHPTAMPAGMTPPNLIHDTDINQVVNELRAAGAEAISVNDQRLVATTSVRTAGSTIFINNVAQTSPYTVKAIGSSTALLSVLNAAGGIASQIRSFDKAMFDVQESKSLTLPAYSEKSEPRYARPVSEAAKATQINMRDLRQINSQVNRVKTQLDSQQLQRQQKDLRLHLIADVAKEETLQAHLKGMNAHLNALKFPAQATHNWATDQTKLLDQEIAVVIAKIARMETTENLTPSHPEVLGAKAQLQALETARSLVPVKEKQEYLKTVHKYLQLHTTAWENVAVDKLRLAEINRQILQDQAVIEAGLAHLNFAYDLLQVVDNICGIAICPATRIASRLKDISHAIDA